MNLRVPYKSGSFLTSRTIISFWGRTLVIIIVWRSHYWKADSHPASQETPCLLRKRKVPYHVHNRPPIVPIQSEMIPVQTFLPYFSYIHSNIIFPFTHRSSKRSLPFSFSNQNIVCISHLSHACYMARPSHPPWFDHPNNNNNNKMTVTVILCGIV